jgi:hypothetical protein
MFGGDVMSSATYMGTNEASRFRKCYFWLHWNGLNFITVRSTIPQHTSDISPATVNICGLRALCTIVLWFICQDVFLQGGPWGHELCHLSW